MAHPNICLQWFEVFVVAIIFEVVVVEDNVRDKILNFHDVINGQVGMIC